MRLGDLDALRKNMEFICMGIMAGTEPYNAPLTEIDNAPTVEPEITEKQAILFLINNGWLVNHDKELRERWERPQGEWVFRNGVTCGGYYKCSKCGEVERAEKNFCPNCGAKMRGGAE